MKKHFRKYPLTDNGLFNQRNSVNFSKILQKNIKNKKRKLVNLLKILIKELRDNHTIFTLNLNIKLGVVKKFKNYG